MKWIHESPAIWDGSKNRVIGAAPEGIFSRLAAAEGQPLAGDWWRVERDGVIVGYGWMDIVWGDGEVLLAVSAEAQGSGVGSFIIERLAHEAKARGLRYIHNSIRSSHPRRSAVAEWLAERQFAPDGDGERWVRKVA